MYLPIRFNLFWIWLVNMDIIEPAGTEMFWEENHSSESFGWTDSKNELLIWLYGFSFIVEYLFKCWCSLLLQLLTE